MSCRGSGAKRSFFLLALLPAVVRATGIVPLGTTATTVTTDTNGKATINIAAPQYGVSYNAFSRFDVSNAGANLNNQVANARYIVGEVVSTSPSTISGPVTVVGPRANVILANPNGITINGGSFVNVGSLALTTGQISFSDTQIAPGLTQRNVLVDTGQGTIAIGPNGLSGVLINLELISRQLSINGPVSNGFSSPSARIRAVTGTSHAEFDTAVSPTDNINPWVNYSTTNPAAPASTAVDITALGSLTAGRIQLIVTDLGAGVNHAGSMLASAGDFSLSANGDVTIHGGRIQSTQSVLIDAPRITTNQATLTAAGDVQLNAQAMHLSNSQLIAGSNSQTGDVLLTSPSQPMTESLTVDTSSLTAAGGIGLFADAQAVSLTGSNLGSHQALQISGSQIALSAAGANGAQLVSTDDGVLLQASGDIENRGGLIQGHRRSVGQPLSQGGVTLLAGGSVSSQTVDPIHPAVLFADADDLLISAGGNITNLNARLISNGALNLTAGGEVRNESLHISGVSGEAQQSYQQHSRNWFGLNTRSSGFNQDFGQLADPAHQAYFVADNGMRVTARDIVNLGGEVDANQGDVVFRAANTIQNQALRIGQVSFERRCRLFLCRMEARNNTQFIGGLVSAAGNVDWQAGTQISNVGGRVLGLDNVTLIAPQVLAQSLLSYTSIDRLGGMKGQFGDRWAQVYAADQGGSFTANQGRLQLVGTGVQDGGSFAGAQGVVVSNGAIEVRRTPRRDPVTLADHVGFTSWLWR